MLEVDFTVNTLVTDVLEGSYKLVLSRASHNLSAVSANKRVSEWLNVRVGSPVLFDENILYDDKNLILAFSKSWFRSDKMQLKSVVYRMK
jgi:DNA-binding GntR family transcriptional regulator